MIERNRTTIQSGAPSSDFVEAEEAVERDLRDYLDALWRRKTLIALVALLFAVPVAVVTSLQTKEYRASTRFVLTPPETVSLGGDPQEGAGDDVAAIQSSAVRRAVREELGYSPAIEVVRREESDVVTLHATHTDPEQAARAANVHTKTFLDLRAQVLVERYIMAGQVVERRIQEIEQQLAEIEARRAPIIAQIEAERQPLVNEVENLERRQQTGSTNEARLIAARAELAVLNDRLREEATKFEAEREPKEAIRAALARELEAGVINLNLAGVGASQLISGAGVPSSPYSPKPVRTTVIALLVGLVIGAVVALAADLLKNRIQSRKDLERAGGLATLAVVPRLGRPGGRSEAPRLMRPDGDRIESYHALRTGIDFAAIQRPIKTVQVTSAEPGAGKTTTTANLAIASALSGQRVLVIDCDFRRSRLSRSFTLDGDSGFTSVLLDRVSVAHAIKKVPGFDHLWLLPAGPRPPDPSGVLGSAALEEAIGTLAAAFDLVVIDSSPILPVVDALVLSVVVDATILVARSGRTRTGQLRRAVDLLRDTDAPVIGAVLNASPVEDETYREYRDYYAYRDVVSDVSSNGSPSDRKRRRQQKRRKARQEQQDPATAEEVAFARDAPETVG